MSGWGTGYSFGCDLVDYSQSPQAMRVSAPAPEELKHTFIIIASYWSLLWTENEKWVFAMMIICPVASSKID